MWCGPVGLVGGRSCLWWRSGRLRRGLLKHGSEVEAVQPRSVRRGWWLVVGLSFGVFGSMWVGCLVFLVLVGVVRRLVRRGC